MLTPRIVKLFYAAAAVVLLSGAFAICQAQVMLQTHVMDVLPGTSFLGHDFVAVPFGTLDFGGAVGEQNTGNAAIVTTNQQVQAAPSHGDDPFGIEKIQLRSATPIDIGFGLDTYYITARPTLLSIRINYGSAGEGNTFFGAGLGFVDIDVRKGSLAGPIVLTARFGLTGGPEPGTYSRTPPRDALLIEGINHLIPGFLNDLEFWPDRMDVTVRGPLYPETGDYILGSLRLVFRPAKTLTVVIDGCDSEVPNILLSSGSTISELVAACAEGANNHGKFVICVDVLIKDLKKDGDITGHEKDAIHKCAAHANIP